MRLDYQRDSQDILKICFANAGLEVARPACGDERFVDVEKSVLVETLLLECSYPNGDQKKGQKRSEPGSNWRPTDILNNRSIAICRSTTELPLLRCSDFLCGKSLFTVFYLYVEAAAVAVCVSQGGEFVFHPGSLPRGTQTMANDVTTYRRPRQTWRVEVPFSNSRLFFSI